jgi:hypothetical protein
VQDGQDIILAVGPQERPRPQIAFTDPSFEGAAYDAAPLTTEPRAAEARSVLAVEICDESGCTVQFQGEEPRKPQVCLESDLQGPS